MSTTDFDAIVVGSGISGGWAAKELTEGGMRVLLIERGRNVEHGKDYVTEFKEPWEMEYRGEGDKLRYQEQYPVQSTGPMNEFNEHFWVNDTREPYTTTEGKPFNWFRGYQLGGRSLTWGRQSLRRSEADFEANKKDGYGVDWPIRYADLAPWYDYVEEFIGVSGQNEGRKEIPDGKFTPPMPFNCVESHLKSQIEKKFPGRVMTPGRTANLTERRPGRDLCKYRFQCDRGCSWGGYFSTQSSTLPAAKKTGLLTVITDTRVVDIDYDPVRKRARGVRVVNEHTRKYQTYKARAVFLCASTFNSLQILLNSRSDHFPNGLANRSGVLGHYIMDHVFSPSAMGMVPGFEERVDKGRRPTYSVILPFRNRAIDSTKVDFLRSYMVAVFAMRSGWSRGTMMPGFGAGFKDSLSQPGPWMAMMGVMGEFLPRKENFVKLDPGNLDHLGLPSLKINVAFGENEKKMAADGEIQCKAMLKAAGGMVMGGGAHLSPPGTSIHEMGGAPMGRDPSTSVLNAYNQCHDVANVFVTDGAAMSSSSAQNPSLTYMAITARAARYAVEQFKAGAL